MLTAAQYRAKAAEYAEVLKAASLPAEVHEYRRLEPSYLMLAENEEWMADNRDRINTWGADENSYGDAILAPPDRVFDDTRDAADVPLTHTFGPGAATDLSLQ